DLVQLRRLLDGDRPVHLLDVRWALDGSKGRHAHLEGHLPGAVYIDLPTELAAPAAPRAGPPPPPGPERCDRPPRTAGDGADGLLPGPYDCDLPTSLAAPAAPGAGRHPLPDPESFAATLRRAGVRQDGLVIAYDDTDGAPAARLVWMLRAAGHEAAVLDGGLSAWDGPLERTPQQPAQGDVTARPWPASAIASIDEVADGDALVIDARAPERYRGDVEPMDPRAG